MPPLKHKIPAKCLMCERPYLKSRHDQKYCSDACYRKNRNKIQWQSDKASGRRRVKEWIESNRDRYNEWRREYGWKQHLGYRLRVIEMLGGKCVSCGISDPRLLTVNHKNGRPPSEKHGKGGKVHLFEKIALGKRDTSDLDLRRYNCNIIYEYERGILRWI